jgi:hypothetical protein
MTRDEVARFPTIRLGLTGSAALVIPPASYLREVADGMYMGAIGDAEKLTGLTAVLGGMYCVHTPLPSPPPLYPVTGRCTMREAG